MPMDAQTFHDLNKTLDSLRTRIQHHQYTDKRSGLIPPDALPAALEDVRDAVATLDAIWTAASAAAYEPGERPFGTDAEERAARLRASA